MRILVFNCHEAWVHQLRLLDADLDIIVGLPGRHTSDWDEAIRPLPPRSRRVTLPEVLRAREAYDCIVTHNLTDLLDVKSFPAPRILMIHLTLKGMVAEQKPSIASEDFRTAVHKYTELTRTHVIAVSRMKGQSWGFEQHIVPLAADPADYLPWRGDLARGLRVSNYIVRRPRTLMWEFHRQAFYGLPVTLVGHNPELPGAEPSRHWQHLKEILQSHRFFIHTAHPELEDGYNMATLEAMAAGLPILGNRHPTSPVAHGVSGFLSDDPAELRGFAERLLSDQALARRMGQAAQAVVLQKFSSLSFRKGMLEGIRRAQREWSSPGSRGVR